MPLARLAPDLAERPSLPIKLVLLDNEIDPPFNILLPQSPEIVLALLKADNESGPDRAGLLPAPQLVEQGQAGLPGAQLHVQQDEVELLACAA
jgi:hypothetical protein